MLPLLFPKREAQQTALISCSGHSSNGASASSLVAWTEAAALESLAALAMGLHLPLGRSRLSLGLRVGLHASSCASVESFACIHHMRIAPLAAAHECIASIIRVPRCSCIPHSGFARHRHHSYIQIQNIRPQIQNMRPQSSTSDPRAKAPNSRTPSCIESILIAQRHPRPPDSMALDAQHARV